VSVAKALREELLAIKIGCEIKNALEFMPKAEKIFLEKGHSFVYRHSPKASGVGYKIEEKKRGSAAVDRSLARYSPRMVKYIKSNGFDIAICVHEFPGLMLTFARRGKQLDIKQYFVATDYTCSPGIEKMDMDAWFIPRGLSNEFCTAGIAPSLLYETGIPVASWCYHPMDKKKAKEELGIRSDIPLVLIGAGSIGCGPLDELALAIKEKTAGKCTVAVLCGHNEKLLNKVSKHIEDEKLMAIPYTDKIRKWLCAADIFFTKAGGLSSTEAATIGLPIVFLNLIPGLEEHNLNYFVSRGCGVTSGDINGLCDTAKGLFFNEGITNSVKKKQKEMFSDNATLKLINYILKEQ